MELVEALIHKEPPRTQYFVEIPHEFGKLRLDLLAPVEIALTQTGMTPEIVRHTNDTISKAQQASRSGDIAGEKKILLDEARQYPFAGSLYGALYDVYERQGDLREAEFYIKQALALQPDYRNMTYLARNLGLQGRLEEAATIQEHLWETRSQAREAEALVAVHDYLVTLGRLQQPRAVLDVALRAMQEFGAETTLVYQYIFGLVLDGQQDAAREQLKRVLPQLDPNDPLYPRFVNMGEYLGLQDT